MKEFKEGKLYQCIKGAINKIPIDEWHYAYDGKPHKCQKIISQGNIIFENIKLSPLGGGWSYLRALFREVKGGNK